jgi:sigma-E factor negative regulatory protein RseB
MMCLRAETMFPLNTRQYRAIYVGLVVFGGLFCAVAVQAQGNAPTAAPAEIAPSETRSVSEWLMRMHEASRRRSYVGTFVVSSSAGGLSSAKIWHACDGAQQMERVESLTGAPRSTYRRNDQVVTFLPDAKVVHAERRESLGLFPGVFNASGAFSFEAYSARQAGVERVAGFEADIVNLVPVDKLRYGYRIWSEKKSGLVVKLQTLDLDGRVLEQVAFSELQLDAPVKLDKLAQQMQSTEGYRVEHSEPLKTTAAAEGWQLRKPVAGFKPMGCYKRPTPRGDAKHETVQWVFSDGLASVSLFVEAFDRQRHVQEGYMDMGATQTLLRRLGGKAGEWWLTAVGEVPIATLEAFAQGLERRK